MHIATGADTIRHKGMNTVLKSLIGQTMTIRCAFCQTEYKTKVPQKNARFLPEFNQFENVSVQCPKCGAIEIFNMNIPPDDTGEPFQTGELPLEEEIQRYYVRLLMRYVREDLKP
ncbi:hypothetical protein GEPA3_3014 [Geobacillus sp. PA-3]|nr:hypothetical protein GEPA3_3014 [Geobacillus sp. PA-3]